MPAPPPPARHLPYVSRLQCRAPDTVDLVVVHCTELPDLDEARAYGERVVHSESQTGNSGHFYIDRDGSIEEWVPVERIAHHVRGCNERSIGIELVNRGRHPHWFDSRHQAMKEPYPSVQISALLQLLEALQRTLASLRWIAGHEELDREWVAASDDERLMVRRKVDPGPLFPWAQVLADGPFRRLPGANADDPDTAAKTASTV